MVLLLIKANQFILFIEINFCLKGVADVNGNDYDDE